MCGSRPRPRDGDASADEPTPSRTVSALHAQETIGCCAVAAKIPESLSSTGISRAFDWNGESRSARPARKTSLFGKPALEADRDEKARSVVALSRDPPCRRSSPVRLRLPVCFSGVSPASCPASRQPTHDHRHVRFGQGPNDPKPTDVQEKNARCRKKLRLVRRKPATDTMFSYAHCQPPAYGASACEARDPTGNGRRLDQRESIRALRRPRIAFTRPPSAIEFAPARDASK